ncbi:hypothetical protein Q3G72_005099 [Acer saccharum]|nr:hypothetical protein Q3G72_005099 [Acer saccharum]
MVTIFFQYLRQLHSKIHLLELKNYTNFEFLLPSTLLKPSVEAVTQSHSMAFRSRQLVQFLSRMNTTGYNFSCLRSSFSIFPFSTLDVQLNLSNQTKNRPEIDERRVLDELSDLLPISRNNSIPNLYKASIPVKQTDCSRVVDGFLLPEEKLRGVFLQNLSGRAAIEHALSNVNVNLSLDLVAKVVDRGNLGGEAMVLFFNWAIKQPDIGKDVYSYNVIVKALGRRKFFDFMVEILHEMSEGGVSFNLETLSIVMDSFIRARRVYKAIEMFENLEEFGMQCNAESLNVLLRCLCRRLHIGAANSFFNAMRGKISFNVTTYDIIIGGWSKLGRVIEVERVLKEMVDEGFSPDSSTYCYLIECLGRSGRVDDAVEIFDAMKEKGCGPDTNAYNAMISNYITIGDFDECMKFYKGMLSNKCEPNMDTYTKLISGFLKIRKVADALEIFEEMLDRGIVPSTGTITSFIEPLCSYGPPHAALMIYNKARKVGCKVSLCAYKLLFMRLSRFGKCGMLLNLWHEMQESGYSTDGEVYEYVICGLCSIGQLENAALVMEESLSKELLVTKQMLGEHGVQRVGIFKLTDLLLASKALLVHTLTGQQRYVYAD